MEFIGRGDHKLQQDTEISRASIISYIAITAAQYVEAWI